VVVDFEKSAHVDCLLSASIELLVITIKLAHFGVGLELAASCRLRQLASMLIAINNVKL